MLWFKDFENLRLMIGQLRMRPNIGTANYNVRQDSRRKVTCREHLVQNGGS